MEFAFIKGLGLGLLLSISVGPVVFTILKLSMKLGHKAGYAFITGVSLSDIILAVLGNVAAELVRSALKYEIFIAIGGASLLIGMGIYSLFFGKDPVMDNSDLAPEFRKRDLAKFSLQGFFMNMLNPAPIFFWLTTCTAFAYLPLNERIMLFGTSLAMVLTTDFLKVKLAGRIRNWLTPATLHKIHYVSAFILILFGVIIAGGILYSRMKGQ
jgi:threonine/homoserine/homoserine lactone efflux protein